ncbi:MAG: hypothetical protein KDB67_08495 [Gordonia sp.]|uniref:hypothetical protein n=1 Tax=Gordonia sp. (in: high G+C Gram-positive bacteria) TaxID=84139 RepID=UPI001DCD84A7|nr:hypothetical protein [Gordonia sp. (in: high G+C Gram-positive bacteria)]MCB1294704.1 hypothetical protein [Gordonia sp. (in: high G+C Gram-positive bacteria)]
MQNDPRIAATAYRHGIDSADILHAWRNVISAGIGTNDMDIAVGPRRRRHPPGDRLHPLER